MSPRALCLALLLLATASATKAEEDDFDYSCIPGIVPTIGVILPRGDIHVETGSDPFDIYCRLNPAHEYARQHGAERLGLFLAGKDDEDDGPRRMQTRIVNATTVAGRYVPGADMRRDLVTCKVDVGGGSSAGVCQQNVFVGKKPLPPEDFKCVSENWSNLNCTWREPENPVRTSYVLSFIQPGKLGSGRDGRRFLNGTRPEEGESSYVECQDKLWYRRMHRGGPHFDTYSGAHYQDYDGTFVFQMRRHNRLTCDWGTAPEPEYFTLDFFRDIVRPSPAEEVTLEATGPESLRLSFKIPHQLEFFPPGLRFSVRFRGEFDLLHDWTELDTSEWDPHQPEYQAELDGLVPYALYDVQIRLLSAKADVAEERLWSEVASISARTLPMRPAMPPRVAQGSFEVVTGSLQERRVYLYWQKIPSKMHHGPGFDYVVTEVSEAGKIRPINPTNVTSAYALFPRLSLQEYSFFLTSRNDMGNAEGESYIFLPRHDEIRGLQPRSFTKIAYSDRQFELSWLAPLNESDVTSYTIFWCKSENNRDRPYQCEGFLQWEEVQRGVRIRNVTLETDGIYQFAVAANSGRKSSGMIWATCTILHDKVVGKLKTVAIDVIDKDALKVRWRLDCSDRVGIVTGYKISYCPVGADNEAADCVGPEEHVIAKPDDEKLWVTGLKPWTYYKVGVAVLTRAGESEMSDFLVRRTERDRPGSPPTELEAVLVGRNGAELYWGPPEEPNAPIDYYEVRYGFRDFRGQTDLDTFLTRGHRARVADLAFNADYTVGVRACTIFEGFEKPICGDDWAEVNLMTGIGKSGRMPTPLVTFRNSTEVLVEWGHAFHQGGPIDHYDLQVAHQTLGESVTLSVKGQSNSVRLSLERLGEDSDWVPDCFNESITNLYNFTIRAVTVDEELDETFLGDWSPVEVTPAYCKRAIPWAIILPVVIILPISAVLAMLYFCKCCDCWRRENDIWKKVTDNLVVASPSQIGSDGNKVEGSGAALAGGGWQRREVTGAATATVGTGRKPAYQRASSKESSETLLPDPKRNASGGGGSDTTSGCESARSSEVGEAELLAGEDSASNKSNSHDISGDSIEEEDIPDEEDDARNTSALTNNSSGYVSFRPPAQEAPPFTGAAAAGTGAPPYTQMGTGGWQPRPYSPPQQVGLPLPPAELGLGTDPDAPLPPGYSKMVADHHPLQAAATPGRGYVSAATAFAAAEPQQPPRRNNLPEVGYVAFENVRDRPQLQQWQQQLQQQQPPQPMPMSPTFPPPPAMPKGYITLAQASKPFSAPADHLAESHPPPPPAADYPMAPEPPAGAYSRVGLGPTGQPQQLPDGYVRPAQPQQVLVASRPASVLSEKEAAACRASSRPVSLAESVSENYREMDLHPSLGSPVMMSPSSAKEFPLSAGVIVGPSAASPYLRMQQQQQHRQQQHQLPSPLHDPLTSAAAGGESSVAEEGDSLVMSPKKLQVETKSPYSRAVTSIQGSKSSMV